MQAFPARRTAAARPSFWRWRCGALWSGRGEPARRPPAVLDRCAAFASSSRAGPAGGLPTGAVHTHAARGRRPDRRRLGGEGHAPSGSAPRRVRQLGGGRAGGGRARVHGAAVCHPAACVSTRRRAGARRARRDPQGCGGEPAQVPAPLLLPPARRLWRQRVCAWDEGGLAPHHGSATAGRLQAL